jgi:DNA helicase-2/ATP-dependent DNA helicase PcrA
MEPLPMKPLDLERDLNPQQVEAVGHGEGPQLVLAGAGSGKTRVITYRIAWLVRERHVDPHTIAAVTFTNKAAAEMRERVEDLLQLYPLPTFVGTFHRFALGMLRRWGERVGLKRDFVIMDTADQRSVVKQALESEGLSEKSFSPRAVLAAISSAKNRLMDPDEFEREAATFFYRRIAPVYRRYQGLLRQGSGVDFDDMIALAVRLLETDEEIRERLRRRVRYLLVDEYQDTNHAQLRLIHGLVGESGNLTAVGDEDQSIYRWRGADLDNILDFEASFPEATVRKLERNYRSTQNILDASGALVARNERRRGKRLWTESGTGEKLEIYLAADELDEARWIVNTLQHLRSTHSLREMAVLVRTNAQTRALEEVLLRQEVPYTLVGGTRFYERAEIKDLVAYLRILRNPRDTFSLLRILNQPPRGIGKVTQDQLWDEASRAGQPVWDLIYLGELGSFSTRATNAVLAFRDLVVDLKKAAEELPLPALLERLIDKTGYADLYDPDDPDDLARRENIQELLSAAQDFTDNANGGAEEDGADALTAFLDHISLVSDIDSWQADAGVSLMTLHSAKGLEFPVVVVAGLEDGLLPHFNAQGAPEDVEEERRLLYVGMTRARERLILTHCRRRRVAGHFQDQKESPFLAELPQELVETHRSPEIFSHDAGRGVHSFFGRAPASAPFGGGAGGEEGPGGLARGSRVRHPTLGPGVILETEGSGTDAKLTIFFERAGKRRLLARYAHLEPE